MKSATVWLWLKAKQYALGCFCSAYWQNTGEKKSKNHQPALLEQEDFSRKQLRVRW